MEKMPKWADVILIPIISIVLAAVISGLVLLATGHDPIRALGIMVSGAMGSSLGWGYTLYYA
ncbi:MAG: ABC transporter permease, partial [Rhodobacteraceae bacterium]|nr:ABC transporter permease [Paracoccaceae bacterium]